MFQHFYQVGGHVADTLGRRLDSNPPKVAGHVAANFSIRNCLCSLMFQHSLKVGGQPSHVRLRILMRPRRIDFQVEVLEEGIGGLGIGRLRGGRIPAG